MRWPFGRPEWCLVTDGTGHIWFCTGGTNQRGSFTPPIEDKTGPRAIRRSLPAPLAGIFSIAFRDSSHGMIVGGDYKKPKDSGLNSAFQPVRCYARSV